MKSRFYILLTIWLVMGLTFAKAEVVSSHLADAVIDVIVEDSSLYNGTYIQTELCKKNINSVYSKDTMVQSKKLGKDRTRITLPLQSAIMYGRISILLPNGLYGILNPNNNLYLFEQGDTLQIYIRNNEVIFKGKCADKFTCLYRIQEQRMGDHKGVRTLLDQNRYDDAIKSIIEMSDLYYNNCIDILYSYKDRISYNVFKLAATDCRASADNRSCGLIDAFSNFKYRKLFFERFKQTIKEYGHKIRYRNIDTATLSQSYWFCDYLLNKEILYGEMNAATVDDQYNLPSHFNDVFGSITERYTGIIKDKLMLIVCYRQSNSIDEKGLALIKLGLNHDRKNIYSFALNQFFTTINKGGDAFPFELEDENGKVYRLRDFRDKLIVMDFWFTGCTGCAILAEQMKPIIKSYAANKQVVFISVSVDKNKTVWKNSLRLEKYSGKDQVNLYTKGLAKDDAVVKYYNIITYPKLIVISKYGKIITVSPPRPHKDLAGSIKQFTQIIDNNI